MSTLESAGTIKLGELLNKLSDDSTIAPLSWGNYQYWHVSELRSKISKEEPWCGDEEYNWLTSETSINILRATFGIQFEASGPAGAETFQVMGKDLPALQDLI